MRDDFSAAVKSVQDSPLALFVLVYLVSPPVPAGDDTAEEPMVVEESLGGGANFPVYRYGASIDTDDLTKGDIIMLGRLRNNRWVAIDKVV